MSLLDQFSNMSPDQTQGLLAAASQILQQSGPSLTPTSFGQIMGGGLQAYQGGVSAARKRKMEEDQQMQMAQLRDMQIQEGAGTLADRSRAREQADALRKFYMQQQGDAPNMPSSGLLGSVPQMTPANPMGGSTPSVGSPPQGGYTPPPSAPMQPTPMAGQASPYSQRMAMAQKLRQSGFHNEADAQEAAALKFQPKVKGWEKVQQNGKVMFAPFFEDGTSGAPVPLEVAEKLEKINVGGSTELANPYTGASVRSIRNTQSPESIASVGATIRGQNMTDSRARDMNAITREGQQTQIVVDPMRGPMLINKGTGVARIAAGADGTPIEGEVPAKRAASAKQLLPIIDEARKLIGGATGSYAGAGADKVAQFFGGGTPGAQNTAKLKVLEGAIMMSQPRMEGPQSDKDVAMYRQMAGQIGDPTVPASLKKSALDSIQEINSRYAGVVNAPQPSPAPKKSALKGQVTDGYRFKGGDPADKNNWEKL